VRRPRHSDVGCPATRSRAGGRFLVPGFN